MSTRTVYEQNGFWIVDYGPNRVYSNMLWEREDAEAFVEPADYGSIPLRIPASIHARPGRDES